MPIPPLVKTQRTISAVDLFCGAGGLTRGLLDAGVRVSAGYDIDATCAYAYRHNNSPAEFHERCVSKLTGATLSKHYGQGDFRVLVGCAPCMPFSSYTQKHRRRRHPKWALLQEFARLVRELKPDIVSMENVPGLQRHSVFRDFLKTLAEEGFHFSADARNRIVSCAEYGLAQHRVRLVLLASRLGPIRLIRPTHRADRYRTVADAIQGLPRLKPGTIDPDDPLHRTSALSPLNLSRIKSSVAGGTWHDWPPHLVAKCHRKPKGQSYFGVYGRMRWNRPSPTITTQFYGFGSGRFGHPAQDRGLSLREGALLQSFPVDYQFVEPNGDYQIRAIGRLIGNAVPVRLGTVIGRSIVRHVQQHVH